MSRLDGWIERFEDSLNPIVVKELRQAAQGRSLPGMLLFFLLIQLVILGGFLLSQGIQNFDRLSGERYGADVFGILMAGLCLVVLFFLPIYVAVRFAVERQGEGLSLLFISTLSPGRIIRGKLLSNLILALLIIAAGLPYLTFTYFLRGIDVPSMVLSLSGVVVWTVLTVMVAIFLAALPVKRLLRALVAIAGLAYFGISLVAVGSLVGEVARTGTLVWTRELFYALATAVGVIAATVGLLFRLTVALVTPPAADRSRPVRLYLFGLWVLTTGILVATVQQLGPRSYVFVWVWLYGWIWLLAVATLVEVSGRDRPSRRVLAQVPTGWRRPLAFLLSGGVAGGLAFVACLALATLGVGQWIVLYLARGTIDPGILESTAVNIQELTGFIAYVAAYALMGLLAQRLWLRRWVSPGYRWTLGAFIAAVLSLTPALVLFLVDPESLDRPSAISLWLVFNPMASDHSLLGSTGTLFAVGLLAVFTLGALRLLMGDYRAFRPPEVQ